MKRVGSFVFLILFFVTSCSQSTSNRVRSQQTESTASHDKAEIPVTATRTVSSSACAQVLENFDSQFRFAVGDDEPSVPTTSAEATLTADEVRIKLRDLSKVIFGDLSCDFVRIRFRSVATAGEYFEGGVTKNDFILLKNGVISEAEFLRRIDLTAVATVESIQLRLAEARAIGDRDVALTLVNAWLEKEPESVLARILKGNVLLDREEYQAASALYQEVLSASPYQFVAWYNLAYAKHEIGDAAAAIAIYQKLLNAQTHYENVLLTADDIHLALADSYFRIGDFTKANEALAQISLAELPAVIMLRAGVKRAQKDSQAAKAILEAHVAKHPSDATALYNLILIHLDLHDAEGARHTFLNLKNADPTLADEFRGIPFLRETHESQ